LFRFNIHIWHYSAKDTLSQIEGSEPLADVAVENKSSLVNGNWLDILD
jgi:hypothetical protein